jgi:hypothetical protein
MINPLNNRTAEKLAELGGSASPRLIFLHWCEHWPKPGEPPKAGEYLCYSLELAKAYGKGKLALGYDVWINNRQWFGD